MLPDENPPQNLDLFRAVAEEHGQRVLRHYDWGGEYTDEDGVVQYVEPGWMTLLVKEQRQADGKIVVHNMLLNDDLDFEPTWKERWVHLIELNDMGFQRTLEEHGYDSA